MALVEDDLPGVNKGIKWPSAYLESVFACIRIPGLVLVTLVFCVYDNCIMLDIRHPGYILLLTLTRTPSSILACLNPLPYTVQAENVAVIKFRVLFSHP